MFKNLFRRTSTLVSPEVDENCDIERVFEEEEEGRERNRLMTGAAMW